MEAYTGDSILKPSAVSTTALEEKVLDDKKGFSLLSPRLPPGTVGRAVWGFRDPLRSLTTRDKDGGCSASDRTPAGRYRAGDAGCEWQRSKQPLLPFHLVSRNVRRGGVGKGSGEGGLRHSRFHSCLRGHVHAHDASVLTAGRGEVCTRPGPPAESCLPWPWPGRAIERFPGTHSRNSRFFS